ncbi:MAG: winged helix-turn-helix domain-containing protein [Gemmatimonadales bacterium]
MKPNPGPRAAPRVDRPDQLELRRKLEADPAAPRHILTVRKAGYRFER